MWGTNPSRPFTRPFHQSSLEEEAFVRHLINLEILTSAALSVEFCSLFAGLTRVQIWLDNHTMHWLLSNRLYRVL